MVSETTVPAANDVSENKSTEPARSRFLDLFLISFLILFFELACILWFGSTVPFLTFFTNLVLLACFLGMSVGLLSARRRLDFMGIVFSLAVVAVVLAAVTSSGRVSRKYVIEVGGQNSPQEVFFGTEQVKAIDPSRFVVPIELVGGVFFVLIALMFVGLGQVMGRAFDAIPGRVVAYTVDILGSLVGIVTFGILSWLRMPPVVWFTLAVMVGLRFIRRLSWWQTCSTVVFLGLIGYLGYRESTTKVTIWSPYYRIHYFPDHGVLSTNNIGHQQMVAVGETGAAYMLPHLLNRDAGRAPFQSVAIVGAGSGNDVSAALMNGVEHVDAVEIEAVLNEIGRNDHPNKPYDDPRVTIQLDDGRSFLRRTRKTYDMIAYAVVDSLVLHSGFSSLRLESFLFTEQAFRDAKNRLSDDGVFVMYNFYRQGWIVGRLAEMAKQVFGAPPVVISLPYRASVKSSDSLLGSNFTLVIAGKPASKALEAIRKKLESDSFFWLSERPLDNVPRNGYGPKPPVVAGVPANRWLKIGTSKVDTSNLGRLPTDEWPFLYLRDARIPALNIRTMALLAFLSLAILLSFAPFRTVRPDARMFFLGAGFMLLETKSIVHLALLFGSTWMVNSIVFAAILIMILLSNLFVLTFKPRGLRPYYAILIAALLVNAFVPMDSFLDLPGVAKVVGSCAVVFVPIFFAGVIFATSFQGSSQPDVDFGSNVAGVILGGLSENFSMVLGFDHLLFIAIAFYLLSAVLGSRSPGKPRSEA